MGLMCAQTLKEFLGSGLLANGPENEDIRSRITNLHEHLFININN